MANALNSESDANYHDQMVMIERCPDCGSKDIATDDTRGEKICTNCGLVIHEKMIDTGQEWRAFTANEQKKRSRTGSPMTLTIHDKGLTTMIGWDDKDALGNKLSSSRRAQIYRLRKWQMGPRLYGSKDKNLTQALAELERLSSQLGISQGLKEFTALIYRKAFDKGLVRGRTIDGMIAASLYAASRIRKVPRPLAEIANESRVDKKEVGKCYRLLIRRLDLQIPVADPLDYVARFGEELKLSSKAQKRAYEILEKAKKEGLSIGRDPPGLAASAIYISSILENERKTQREIASLARVTEVTVRNRYKELVKKLGISFAT